ncbi:hypothetical protein EsDP_00001375 [Epichloe bromicola]|uniref:Uncharacterized protein n=1 Tax=Epichloe bromicola TaxID=79588 RepID=A0ABQ0CHN8_9HYPO
MPIRNPFARRSGLVAHDELPQPEHVNPHPGFERVDTVGSKASSSLSLRSNKSHDTGEYKMSVVNDSGVYLPPSPTEEKGQWPPRRYLSSRASTDTRSSFGDIEHFPISRESFDSYRRSFDIQARSPVVSNDSFGRQSLDSARYPRLPRTAINRKFEHQPPTAEEGFEDVGLDDQKQQPRKRGFFSKLTDSQDASGQQTVSRFLMPGRKRGHSGQGAELNSISQSRDS